MHREDEWKVLRASIPTVTGIPASLRMSRVGRVTKPAPSMSTLLEAQSCKVSLNLRGDHGLWWGGAVYCWDAILGGGVPCLITRLRRGFADFSWQGGCKQRHVTVFWICGFCSLTRLRVLS